MLKRWVLTIIIVLVLAMAHAKMETVYASYKYIMGDNDSKNDAKRICFMEAKRLLIEKIRPIRGHFFDLDKDSKDKEATPLLFVLCAWR